MKLTSDRCVDCGRQTDYAGLRGGDWVPVCRRDCQDDCCNGSTKGRGDMNRTHERLDSLEQIRCRGGGLSLSDEIWLVDTARRAIEALEWYRDNMKTYARDALDEIEAWNVRSKMGKP